SASRGDSCRQFFNERTTSPTRQIQMPGHPLMDLPQLLPAAFGPRDLGVEAALMAPQWHGLTLDAPDPLTAAALAAANASYAPYSQAYSGVALATRDGAIVSGA